MGAALNSAGDAATGEAITRPAQYIPGYTREEIRRFEKEVMETMFNKVRNRETGNPYFDDDPPSPTPSELREIAVLKPCYSWDSSDLKMPDFSFESRISEKDGRQVFSVDSIDSGDKIRPQDSTVAPRNAGYELASLSSK